MKAILMLATWVWMAPIIACSLYAQQPPAVHTRLQKKIEVSANNTTTLVFSSNIRDADRGSDDIMIQQVSGFPSVLKVKAARENFAPTNLSVFTDDGTIHVISVKYDASPDSLCYPMLDSTMTADGVPYMQKKKGTEEFRVKNNCLFIASLKPERFGPTIAHHGMKMSLQACYIEAGVLYFKFKITNRSTIPFTMDFVRFYQRDRFQTRRSSSMERDMHPLTTSDEGKQVINAHSSVPFVAAFEQFTISDLKYFCVELFEHGGDRHLKLNLKGRTILRAKPLPDRQIVGAVFDK